jgi:hypothetical protein
LLALLAMTIREPRRHRAAGSPPIHVFTGAEVLACFGDMAARTRLWRGDLDHRS